MTRVASPNPAGPNNEWDATTKTSRPTVLHSFGREDQLDRDAIRRLIASLTRLLDPNTALTSTDRASPAGLACTSSLYRAKNPTEGR